MVVELPSRGDSDVKIDGRTVRLTNLDKILWPQAAFSKRDMITYYLDISPFLLTHIAGRPLTLKRAPNGVDGWYWFQTQCPHPPEWVPTRRIQAAGRAGRSFDYCVIDDVASLVWVANMAAIELHPLLSWSGAGDEAEAIVFDLDPGPPAGMAECCRVALALKPVLEEEGMTPLVKTSGFAGLHVYGLLPHRRSFFFTRARARSIAVDLRAELAGLVTTSRSLADRSGRILIDWSQNSALRSMVAPYSLRAAAIPTVSTPLVWDEVQAASHEGSAEDLVFWPDQVVDRTKRWGDLFRPIARDAAYR